MKPDLNRRKLAEKLVNELLSSDALGDDERSGPPATPPPGGGGGGGDGDGGGGNASGGGDVGGEYDGEHIRLTQDLIDRAGIVSSNSSEQAWEQNKRGWNKFVKLISRYANDEGCTLTDAVEWILKCNEGMPGIETLWIMTKDERLRDYTDFSDGTINETDSLCVSYFYGGSKRKEMYMKYASKDPDTMANSISICFDNMGWEGVQVNGNTVTLDYFDDSTEGEWGPTGMAAALKSSGWNVSLTNDGNKFTMVVAGFGGGAQPTGRGPISAPRPTTPYGESR